MQNGLWTERRARRVYTGEVGNYLARGPCLWFPSLNERVRLQRDYFSFVYFCSMISRRINFKNLCFKNLSSVFTWLQNWYVIINKL